MKNHELVPLQLIAAIAGIHRGAVARILSDLQKNSLVLYERGKRCLFALPFNYLYRCKLSLPSFFTVRTDEGHLSAEQCSQCAPIDALNAVCIASFIRKTPLERNSEILIELEDPHWMFWY